MIPAAEGDWISAGLVVAVFGSATIGVMLAMATLGSSGLAIKVLGI
jgi:hypothetical protein